MTAISALISKNWLVVASDSLLTEVYPDKNKIIHLEFKKSKIVPIRKFKAAAAYWGLAKIDNWRTYDFLKEQAASADKFEKFEDFAINIKDKLNEKLNGIKLKEPSHKGIGIHLVGYETIDQQIFPELFLISNYLDLSYTTTGNLEISRNLYNTLPANLKQENISLDQQRNIIKRFLDDDGIFIFNNGDPALFTPAANAIHAMFRIAIERGVVKNDNKTTMQLASKPIQMIKEIQNGLFKKEHIRVGGKIHHLLITERGDFISNTGDNKF
jgi:hypothetical protein